MATWLACRLLARLFLRQGASASTWVPWSRSKGWTAGRHKEIDDTSRVGQGAFWLSDISARQHAKPVCEPFRAFKIQPVSKVAVLEIRIREQGLKLSTPKRRNHQIQPWRLPVPSQYQHEEVALTPDKTCTIPCWMHALDFQVARDKSSQELGIFAQPAAAWCQPSPEATDPQKNSKASGLMLQVETWIRDKIVPWLPGPGNWRCRSWLRLA